MSLPKGRKIERVWVGGQADNGPWIVGGMRCFIFFSGYQIGGGVFSETRDFVAAKWCDIIDADVVWVV